MRVQGPIEVGEVEKILKGAKIPDQPLKVSIRLVNGKGEIQAAPSVVTKPGESAEIEVATELVYPTEFDLIEVKGEAVTPTTPRKFEKELVGLRIEVTPTLRGSLIFLKGEIEMKEFDKKVAAPGDVFRPIMNKEGVVLTENKVELQTVRSYRTPLIAALSPASPTKWKWQGRTMVGLL